MPSAAGSPLVYVAGPLFDDGERWWIERVEQTGIDRCEIVVASLNGLTTDDGTAWELGYAYATGKHLIGLNTDWRRRFNDEVVNLMIERSLHELVHSLDELTSSLTAWGPLRT